VTENVSKNLCEGAHTKAEGAYTNDSKFRECFTNVKPDGTKIPCP
jgi:hypothetical protein